MVAVVAGPPLLLPELATGAAAETADLRAACVAAATRLAGAASRWICVGADDGGRRTVLPDARGSFVGFGADVEVGLDTAGSGAPVDRRFPLPLLIAGWLAGRTGAPVRVRGELVAPDAPPNGCAALGRALATEDGGGDVWGLLVVGDGAATHSEKAPGHLDERAGPFDAAAATALRDADPAALAALDPDLATALSASGRAPWQVLAGAVTGQWRGELLHSSIPFGVAYHVAVWTPCGA
jgi:hypothetical protein